MPEIPIALLPSTPSPLPPSIVPPIQNMSVEFLISKTVPAAPIAFKRKIPAH